MRERGRERVSDGVSEGERESLCEKEIETEITCLCSDSPIIAQHVILKGSIT